MRRMSTTLMAATVAAAVSLVSLSAQTKPSFTGKWTLVPDAAAAAGGGRGGGGFGFCGMECTMAQDAATLTVTRAGQNGDVKSVYKLDGSESANTTTFGEQSFTTKAKATWDGAKLSIVTVSDFNGQSFTATTVLSLDASGGLVIERTAPGFQDPTPTTTKQNYKKG